jgi:acetyl-CoA carboxylase biotin carboxyl carrier protein
VAGLALLAVALLAGTLGHAALPGGSFDAWHQSDTRPWLDCGRHRLHAREEDDMKDVELRAELAANVWKIVKKVDDKVDVDDEVAILESMKMEIPVVSEFEGKIKSISVKEGQSIKEGDLIAVIEPKKA